MKLFKTIMVAAAISMTSVSAYAEEVKMGDLTLSNTWTRATPPNAKAGGGFVTITNNGAEADRLVSAASDVSKRVEIHEMAVADGVMKMRELENGIEIPAGETVVLKPGGLHIMFMGLNGKFEEGQDVAVSLTFEKAGSVDIDLSVAAMGAKKMNHDHGHSHDHGGGHSHDGHKHDDHSGHSKN